MKIELNGKEILLLSIFFTALAIYLDVFGEKHVLSFIIDHIIALVIAIIIAGIVSKVFLKFRLMR